MLSQLKQGLILNLKIKTKLNSDYDQSNKMLSQFFKQDFKFYSINIDQSI